jgi:hypothetical protein
VKTSQRNHYTKKAVAAGTVMCVLAIFGPSAAAQSTKIVERLSPDTVFYMRWNGAASLKDVNSKNHMLQLWNDPDFAAVKLALAAKMSKDLAKPGSTNPGPQLADILSLLDNACVFGVTMPEKHGTDTAGKQPKVGVFLVYDATGKSELIQKLEAAKRAQSKNAEEITHYDFGGTPIDVEGKEEDKSYTAHAANYFLFANRKDVIEDMVTRYGSEGAPGATVVQRPEYAASRKYADADASIEFFGWMPNLAALIPNDPKNAAASHVVQNLHLEKIHALTASVSLSGEATRMHGALLGDASPGSLFDLWGESSSAFPTMAAVSASPWFQIMRFNLAALYNLVVGAAEEGLTPQQAANMKAGEAMAQAYLGMPIGDALGLFTGEYAWASYYSAEGEQERLFAITIQKPEAVLRIARATLGNFIVAEDTSGGATFLDFAYPYKDPQSGTERRRFYYVGVTPNMLLAAPRKAMLRDVMARVNTGGPASAGNAATVSTANATQTMGAASSAEYAALRSQLPEKLSGLNAADLRQVPWEKVLANWMNEIGEAAKKDKNSNPQDLDWLKLVKPETLTRHLHMSVGGWWKDANGIYFDSSLQ